MIRHFRCPAMMDAAWNSPCITVWGVVLLLPENGHNWVHRSYYFSLLKNKIGLYHSTKKFPFVWRIFQLRNIQYSIKTRCIGVFGEEGFLHNSTSTTLLHGSGLWFFWNHINVYHAVSKPHNLTCWHLTPLPFIQTGCIYWQMYIEMESLANGHVRNKNINLD